MGVIVNFKIPKNWWKLYGHRFRIGKKGIVGICLMVFLRKFAPEAMRKRRIIMKSHIANAVVHETHTQCGGDVFFFINLFAGSELHNTGVGYLWESSTRKYSSHDEYVRNRSFGKGIYDLETNGKRRKVVMIKCSPDSYRCTNKVPYNQKMVIDRG